MNSRDHIMFGSVAAWMYTDVVGLTQPQVPTPRDVMSGSWSAPTAGFSHVRAAPQVTRTAVQQADGWFDSLHGNFSISWYNHTSGAQQCGETPENFNVSLDCGRGSGVIEDVVFASFGTPTGYCGVYRSDASCDANTTLEIVRGACVGQSSCSILASDKVFGDPCYGTFKRLFVEATCSDSRWTVGRTPVLSMAVTVPPNTRGTIAVPVPDPASPESTSFQIIDQGAGASCVVWEGGSYRSGCEGVLGASLVGGEVEVEVVSGSYELYLSE